MYAKVVAHTGRSRVRVGAIVLAAALATAITVTLAGGAMAASQHSKAVKHHSKTTARFETRANPGSTRDVGSPAPGSRDVGFTG